MNETGWLIFYSAMILLFSLAGGSIPLLGRVTHNKLQYYLSASAGVMLGASFFHVMPDAMEFCGSPARFGWWMSLGAVGMFCIERFIAPHSHEVNGSHHRHAGGHGHPGHAPGHRPEESVAAANTDSKEHTAAAPAVAGWMAVLGLTIHTFMNGVGLAGAVQAGQEEASLSAGVMLAPGLAMFLAIFLHKPADALAISTVLSRKGVGRRKIAAVQLFFACMVPVGATAFILAREVIRENLESELTGAALAFSAGTFLFIALSDLLPEVQFHRHDRIPLFLALILGLAFMGLIAYLEPHEQKHAPAPAEHQKQHDERSASLFHQRFGPVEPLA